MINRIVRLVSVIVTLSFVLASAQVEEVTPSVQKEGGPTTVEVQLDGQSLFRVRGVTAFTASQRADAISSRIRAFAADQSLPVDQLQIQDDGQVTTIVAGSTIIVTVVDADAQLENVNRTLLARVLLTRIQGAVLKYRYDRSANALMLSLMKSLGATIVLAVFLILIRFLFRRLEAAAGRRYRDKIADTRVQSLKIVEWQRIWDSVRSGLIVVRNLIGVALLIAYIDYVLVQFPWTRSSAQQFLAIVLNPLRVMGSATLRALPGLVFIAILFTIVRYLLRFLRLLFGAVERGTMRLQGFEAEWAIPTFRIVRLMVIAFAIVVAYPYLPGSDSAAFKGVSLFLGVILSLGSSSAIANIIAGYSLTYRRAYRVGDRVQIGDTIGDVVEVRLQVTHLRSRKNEEVIIPNSVILNAPVVNFSSFVARNGLILHTTVGIGYETPWRQVEAMLLEAARRTPTLLLEPAPFVRPLSLGDFAVNYELNVYSGDPHAQERQYAALHTNILDVFNEFGVQIMTPNYEGDPAEPKLVPPDQWFAPPAQPKSDNGESDN